MWGGGSPARSRVPGASARAGTRQQRVAPVEPVGPSGLGWPRRPSPVTHAPFAPLSNNSRFPARPRSLSCFPSADCRARLCRLRAPGPQEHQALSEVSNASKFGFSPLQHLHVCECACTCVGVRVSPWVAMQLTGMHLERPHLCVCVHTCQLHMRVCVQAPRRGDALRTSCIALAHACPCFCTRQPAAHVHLPWVTAPKLQQGAPLVLLGPPWPPVPMGAACSLPLQPSPDALAMPGCKPRPRLEEAAPCAPLLLSTPAPV